MKPTQEQVIAWAREAGLEQTVSIAPDGGSRIVSCPPIDPLERFATLAYEAGRKDENESCAEVCEEIARLYSTDIFPEDGTSIDCNSAKMGRVVTRNCALCIRARREQ